MNKLLEKKLGTSYSMIKFSAALLAILIFSRTDVKFLNLTISTLLYQAYPDRSIMLSVNLLK